MSEKNKMTLKPSGIKPPNKKLNLDADTKKNLVAAKALASTDTVANPLELSKDPGSQLPSPAATSSNLDKPKTAEEGRGPLADVTEECIGDTESDMSQYSTSLPGMSRKMSINSNGTDGSRPSTDQSLVLTKNTDSFIIGQRVWLGGKRAGQIAYIGETQFAPGDWAGIVLDEANGKNDGCVSGVRYFQCPPRRGVFARLTKLTHSPLEDDEQTPNRNDMSQYSTYSTQNSQYAMPSSKRASPAPSVTSISSRSPSKIPQIGERVIVQSSAGSRVGVLRFVGDTKFANGTWCGVELDEPTGKNDGCVEGHRYFVCPPKHGLFALASKVTLSPSARKATRANSRESLLSSTSRMTSPGSSRPLLPRQSMQDLLKEKQYHIEQLLKEREMERTEVDQAMLKASQARKDYERLKSSVLMLQEENLKLRDQVEDEARKAEDLQFNVLEQTIYKEDLSKINDERIAINNSNSEKITELERMLKERDELIKELRMEALQSVKSVSAGGDNESEMIITFKNQLKQAHELLQVVEADKAEMLANLERTTTQYEKQSEMMKAEFKRETEIIKQKLSEALEKLETRESIALSQDSLSKENSRLKIEFSSKQADLEAQLEICSKQNAEIEDLKAKIKQVETELQLKSIEITAKDTEKESLETNLKKELDDSKILVQQLQKSVDDKSTEIDTFKKQTVDLEDQINYHKKLVEELKSELVNRDSAIESQYISMKSVEHSLKEELDNKCAEFAASQLTYEKNFADLKTAFSNLENEKQQSLEELQLKLDAERTSFKINADVLEKTISSLEENLRMKDLECSQVSESFQKKLDESCQQKDNLQKLVQGLETTVKEVNEKLVNLEKELSEKEQAQGKLELERDDLMRKQEALQDKVNDLDAAKINLEKNMEELLSKTYDSNSELMKMASDLKIKDQELTSAKEALAQNKINYESSKQQLLQELGLKSAEWEKKISHMEGQLKELEQNRLDLSQTVENQKTDFVNQKLLLEQKLKEIHKGKQEVSEFVMKIEALEKENQRLIEESKQKHDELDKKAQNLLKLEEELQSSKKVIESLEKSCNDFKEMHKVDEDKTNDLQKKLDVTKAEAVQLKQQIELLHANSSKESQDLAQQLVSKDTLINELRKTAADNESQQTAELNKLTIELKEKQSQCDKLLNTIQEKDKQLEQIQTESKLNLDNLTNELEKNKISNCELDQNLQAALRKLEDSKSVSDGQLAHLNNEIQRLSAENEFAKKVDQEKTEQLKNLQLELTNNKSKVESLQLLNASMQKNMPDVDSIQKKMEEKDKAISELRQKFVTATERVAMLIAEKESNVPKVASLEFSVEKLKKELLEKTGAHHNRISELLDKVKASESSMQKASELKDLEIQKLENEVQKLTMDKLNMEMEIAQLRSDESASETSEPVANNNNVKSKDKLFLESQVQFLNSIIADMKQKEYVLQTKVDALEGGNFNPEFNIKIKKEPAPRLYCDICEEFDAHDTEDCPRQNTDSPTKPQTRVVPPPRPYCEICEVFGHESENCDAEETY